MPVKTIEWKNNAIHIIDQTLLPSEYKILEIKDIPSLAEAIYMLRVRGAPAIGIAAGMGVALAAKNYTGSKIEELNEIVQNAIQVLSKTRPTAVNLFWALDRMEKKFESLSAQSVPQIQNELIIEAQNILKEDKEICRQMGRNGAELLPENGTVLTHCNAGGLATADYGTALGVIYAAVESGKNVHVFADETRPLLQGARLTAWELRQSNIPVTVICDNMAGVVMQQGKVDCVIVGADRIAANGDAANKIGTYALAVLAEKHNIPFYVVAPISTFDFDLESGKDIPIEERNREEIIRPFNHQIAPEDVDVYNPAFDVTPHEFITAIVTERGVVKNPHTKSLSIFYDN